MKLHLLLSHIAKLQFRIAIESVVCDTKQKTFTYACWFLEVSFSDLEWP